jgi:hypothetical protein
MVRQGSTAADCAIVRHVAGTSLLQTLNFGAARRCYRIGMRSGPILTAVLLTGCGPFGSLCAERTSNGLGGGTGVISVDALGTSDQSGFGWIDDASPAIDHRPSFSFDFGRLGTIEPAVFCDGADWAKLTATSNPVPIAGAACAVDLGKGATDHIAARLESGTITTDSKLDDHGDGTVTVTLDVPTTTFTVGVHTGTVTMTHLRGTATFASEGCPSNNGNGFY